MKAGNRPGHRGQQFGSGGSGGDSRGQRRLVGQALHDNRVVDHLSALKRRSRRGYLARREGRPEAKDVARVGQYRRDALVHLWRQARVEQDLLLAELAAQVRGRIVEEAEIFGFFQLIDALAGEQYSRGVSLNYRDRLARRQLIRKCLGPSELGQERGKLRRVGGGLLVVYGRCSSRKISLSRL